MILPASSCKDKDSSKLTFAISQELRGHEKPQSMAGRQRMLVSNLFLFANYYCNYAGVSVGFVLHFGHAFCSTAQQHTSCVVSISSHQSLWHGSFATTPSGCITCSTITSKSCEQCLPYYLYNYFKVSGQDGWISLGGVLLRITDRLHVCLPSFSLKFMSSWIHIDPRSNLFSRWGEKCAGAEAMYTWVTFLSCTICFSCTS